MWFYSIYVYANGEKFVEILAKQHSILSGNSLKNEAQKLKSDMKITKLHSSLIPCDNFDLQQYIGSL